MVALVCICIGPFANRSAPTVTLTAMLPAMLTKPAGYMRFKAKSHVTAN